MGKEITGMYVLFLYMFHLVVEDLKNEMKFEVLIIRWIDWCIVLVKYIRILLEIWRIYFAYFTYCIQILTLFYFYRWRWIDLLRLSTLDLHFDIFIKCPVVESLVKPAFTQILEMVSCCWNNNYCRSFSLEAALIIIFFIYLIWNPHRWFEKKT